MIVSASASSIVLKPEGRTPDLSQQKWGNSQNVFCFFFGGGGEEEDILHNSKCYHRQSVMRGQEKELPLLKRSQAAAADSHMLNDTNPRLSVCADWGASVSA